MSDRQLVPINQIREMATAVASSGLFTSINTPEKAMALMLLCEAEGLHPMRAVQRYHIIQGQPAMKADTMLGEFQNRGGTVEWEKYEDNEVIGIFKSKGSSAVTVSWDMDRARAAGLTGKDNWRKYPRQMLKARVISEGVRISDPAICSGVYTPEEIENFKSKPVETPATVSENQTSVAPEATGPAETKENIKREKEKESDKKEKEGAKDYNTEDMSEAEIVASLILELSQCNSPQELNNWLSATLQPVKAKISEPNYTQVNKAFKNRFSELQEEIKNKATAGKNAPSTESKKKTADAVASQEKQKLEDQDKDRPKGHVTISTEVLRLVMKICLSLEDENKQPFLKDENDSKEFIQFLFNHGNKDVMLIPMSDAARFVSKFNNFRSQKELIELYCKFKNKTDA